MSSDTKPIRIVRGLLVGASITCIVAVLLAMVLRVGFPLELEWMEGGVMHQAHRFGHGESLYPPPGRDFVPFLYTPGFSVLLGVLGRGFGIDYPLGRIISIVSCVAIGWALWRAVGTAGKPRAHRVAAVGMFAAGYVFTFRWLDLARPDALYMALTLWGLVLLRESRGSHRTAALAGLCMALAFWTKQTAATFVLASGVGALLVAPRQLLTYAATIALIDGGGVLVGNAVTDGRLWHYIYELHQSHAFNDERFEKKTWGMFVHAGPFVLLAGIVGATHGLGRIRRSAERRRVLRDGAYWLLMAATGLLVSGVGYATQWAEPNAFIPGVVMGAVFVAVAMPIGRWSELVAGGLVVAQLLFALLVEPRYQPIQSRGWAGFSRSYTWQDPGRTIPSAAQRRAAAELREALQLVDGPVLALQRPWWSMLAGGDGHVGSMGINDVTPDDRRAILRALQQELEDQHFAQVWIEGEPPQWMLRALSGYRVQRRRHGAQRVRPMSGYMSEAGMVTRYRSDQVLYLPLDDRPVPEGAEVVADFERGDIEGFEVEGRAFGRRAARGITRTIPPVGPYGGRYFLSSAGASGKLAAVGTARSPRFVLPASGTVQLLAGSTGGKAQLSIAIEDATDPQRRVELPLPRSRLELRPVQWTIPAQWASGSVRLYLEDRAENAALFIDDVWLVPDPDGAAER